MLIRKERRNYRKRRHKPSTSRGVLSSAGLPITAGTHIPIQSSNRGLSCFSDVPSASSEDEVESAVIASQSDADDVESDVEKQGPFSFRRKLHCSYIAVNLKFFVLKPVKLVRPYIITKCFMFEILI